MGDLRVVVVVFGGAPEDGDKAELPQVTRAQGGREGLCWVGVS